MNHTHQIINHKEKERKREKEKEKILFKLNVRNKINGLFFSRQ